MKKIMMMMVAGLAASSMVMADDIEQIDEGTTTSGAFDGLYVGAGVGGSFLKNKGHANLKDTADSGTQARNVDMKTSNINRFNGDVFVGFGKTINGNFYLGGELLLEFAGSKTKNVTEANGNELKYTITTDGADVAFKVKNKGFTPELTLKAGYVSGNNIFYAKAGIARPEASLLLVKAADGVELGSCKVNKIVPVVYLGAARAFCNKWNANIEVGYQFQQKKDFALANDTSKFDIKADVKVNKGWKVRAGVAHTFSF